MLGELKIFSGRAHPALTEEICEYLNVAAGRIEAYNFSDGEIFCQVEENVRGSDVFVVQPTCQPVNDTLVELLIMLDTFKRSSASRVTAVIPYYGYARQDKKDQPRVPITAKLVADLISRAGADRVLTMDLHADQIQGFFDVPVDHLFAAPVLLDAVRDLHIPDLVIVSPDAGGVERARAIAKRLGVGLAIVDKRRTAPNTAEVMHVSAWPSIYTGTTPGHHGMYHAYQARAGEQISVMDMEPGDPQAPSSAALPAAAPRFNMPRRDIRCLELMPPLPKAPTRACDCCPCSAVRCRSEGGSPSPPPQPPPPPGPSDRPAS